MEEIRFRNVSGLGVFGAEWTSDDGTTYQLVNSHGSWDVSLGIKPAGRDKWTSVRVDKPERFGMDKPPRKWGEFAAIVRAFLAASADDEYSPWTTPSCQS